MKNIISTANSYFTGKRTFFAVALVFVALFGVWQKWWEVPAEFYAALLAAGMAFLRLAVARVESTVVGESEGPKNESEGPPPAPPSVVGLAVLLSVVIVGCSTPSAATFRSEKLATDTAHGALLAWRDYYKSATNGAPPEVVAELLSKTVNVNSMARGFAELVENLEWLRVAAGTNSALTSQTVATASAVTVCASNLVWTVKDFQK